MKKIKSFRQFGNKINEKTIYNQFESATNGVLPTENLPDKICIIKQIDEQILQRTFILGNVMKNANMTQTIYTAEKPLFGHPDEMSIDIYYYQNHDVKMNIDIIYGDYMSCEFSLSPPNKIDVIQYTSYRSQFDPSNTVFAFDDNTIQKFCLFFNQIKRKDIGSSTNGFEQLFKIEPEDLKFLDKRDALFLL